MGKIEAVRHNARKYTVSGTSGKPAAGRSEGNGAVVQRVPGAIMRALLIAGLVVLPAAVVPGLPPEAQQTVALVALFAAFLTYAEYTASAPGLIEFRDAPPFNRIRFGLILVTILALSLIERGRTDPSNFSQLVEAVGYLVGRAMDMPFSPVRLVVDMLSPSATEAELSTLRSSAGIAYLICLVGLIIFWALLRGWPNPRRSFNVWVNLPTFDPTSGSDIVARLDRDARINIALGFMLPFLMPVVVRFTLGGIDPQSLTAPHVMIWVVAAWSFLPASLMMRGIALGRIAQMVRAKIRASETEHSDALAA